MTGENACLYFLLQPILGVELRGVQSPAHELVDETLHFGVFRVRYVFPIGGIEAVDKGVDRLERFLDEPFELLARRVCGQFVEALVQRLYLIKQSESVDSLHDAFELGGV